MFKLVVFGISIKLVLFVYFIRFVIKYTPTIIQIIKKGKNNMKKQKDIKSVKELWGNESFRKDVRLLLV